jgi:MFS family permease
MNSNSSSREISLIEPLLPTEESAADDDPLSRDPRPPETEGRQEVVSKNVYLTLAFTWFAFAGRSMWNQSVLATFIFLIRDGNPEAVGFVTAVMGLSQLLVSFPVGFLADRYRRDTMLKLASVVGMVAVMGTLLSLHLESFSMLVVALAVWGVQWGITNTALSALFADSIPNGERSHYFTQRSILLKFGNVTGPLVALIMFAYLGDEWTMRECSIVMAVGQALTFPAVLLLCFFNDDDAISEEQPAHEDLIRDQEENGFRIETESESSRSSADNSLNADRGDNNESVVEEEEAQANSCFRYLGERSIPVKIALADVTSGLASGMSIRYFPIFFCDNLRLTPVIVQVLYMASPLLQAALMKIAQRASKKYGRCKVAVLFKWTGISFMLLMVASYVRGLPVWLVCLMYVIRTSFMNSTGALTKSVLMDNIPQGERGKWSAMESVNSFSWSGSAALGGLLVGYEGIVFNFCVTACLQLLGTLPLAALIATDKAEGATNESDGPANHETIASHNLTIVDSTEGNGPIQEESPVVDNKPHKNSLEDGGFQ